MNIVLRLVFLFGFIVINAQGQNTQPDCCLNELCPYDCVRCDGRATCYDLSDELGCNNSTDNYLMAYPKPPIFMPSVMDTVKSHLLKQKKELASTYPHRQCVNVSPAVQYGQVKGATKEIPVWLRLLEKLKAEAATTTTTTTTTTQPPVWLLLLERLKAELASRTEPTTTTTPRPTTTTEESLLDLILTFLRKKQSMTTQDSLPTTDYTQLQIKPTEKRTPPVPQKIPSTSTQRIPKSTILFSATDVASLFSQTESPQITAQPNILQAVLPTSQDEQKELSNNHQTAAVPKSPIDSIYSISGRETATSGFDVKTVTHSNPSPKTTVPKTDSDVSSTFKTVTSREQVSVSKSAFNTELRSVDISVTAPTPTTSVLSNTYSETRNTTVQSSVVTEELFPSTKSAKSILNRDIITTVTQSVTGVPISDKGGVFRTSTTSVLEVDLSENTTNLNNEIFNLSTESSSMSALGLSSDFKKPYTETVTNSPKKDRENIEQEIITNIPSILTSTDSFKISTEGQTSFNNKDKLFTVSSVISETSITQGENATDNNAPVFNSTTNLLNSTDATNHTDAFVESMSVLNINDSSTLSQIQEENKLATTEAASTVVSGFRQTVPSVTTKSTERNEQKQNHANPVKLFVNLSEISEMVYTSTNTSNSTNAPPTMASKVLTSLFTNHPVGSSDASKDLASSVKVDQMLKSDPRPTEWTAGSLSANIKKTNNKSVSIHSSQSLLKVKDSFLVNRNTFVNPDNPKVTEKPVQKYVSPSIPENRQQNIGTSSKRFVVPSQSSATSLPSVYQVNMIPSTTTSSWWGATNSPFGLGDIWGRTTTFPTTTSSWWGPTTVNSFWNSLFGYAPTTLRNVLVPDRTNYAVYPISMNSPRSLNSPITQTIATPTMRQSAPTETKTIKEPINLVDQHSTIPTTTKAPFYQTDSIVNMNMINNAETSTKLYQNNYPMTQYTLSTPKTQTWLPSADTSTDHTTSTITSTTPFSVELSTETSTTDSIPTVSTPDETISKDTTIRQINYDASINNTESSTGIGEQPTSTTIGSFAVTRTLAELRSLYLKILSQRLPNTGTDIYNISTDPFVDGMLNQNVHNNNNTFAGVTQTPIVTTTQEFVKPIELSKNNSADIVNWWHSLAQSTTYLPDTPRLSGSSTNSLFSTNSESTSYPSMVTTVRRNAIQSSIKPTISTTIQTVNNQSAVNSQNRNYFGSSVKPDNSEMIQGANYPPIAKFQTEKVSSFLSTPTLAPLGGPETSTEQSKISNRVEASISNVFTSIGNIDKFVYELDKELKNREARAQVLAKPTLSVSNGDNIIYNITEPPLAEWAVTSRYEPYRSTSMPNHSWWSKIITAVTQASPKFFKPNTENRDTQTITYNLFKTTGSPFTTQNTLVEANKNLEIINKDVSSLKKDQLYISTGTPVTQAIATKRECKLVMDGGEFCKNRAQGYYKNQNDCRTFFVCEWSNRFMCHCPPGTMFDVTIDVCNWDFNVTC